MPSDIRYIDIHTHARKPDILCLVSYCLGSDKVPTEPEHPFTAGIHPWDVPNLTQERLDESLLYLAAAPVNAMGETGLDYLKGGDRDKQQRILRAQLDIARSRNLPVIIHCVKAYNDLFTILKEYSGVKTILHGYTGSIQQTLEALEIGCYISIGTISLISPKTIESLVRIPAHRLFAETDESDLPIALVYEKIANIKHMQVAELAKEIDSNFNRIFNRKDE